MLNLSGSLNTSKEKLYSPLKTHHPVTTLLTSKSNLPRVPTNKSIISKKFTEDNNHIINDEKFRVLTLRDKIVNIVNTVPY